MAGVVVVDEIQQGRRAARRRWGGMRKMDDMRGAFRAVRTYGALGVGVRAAAAAPTFASLSNACSQSTGKGARSRRSYFGRPVPARLTTVSLSL